MNPYLHKDIYTKSSLLRVRNTGGKQSRRNKKQKKGGKSKRRSNGLRNKTFKKMRGG
jgi:hypothetical protein